MYNKNIIELFCKIFHLLHGVTAHPVYGRQEVNQVETEPAKHRDSKAERQGSARIDSSADRRGWPGHDIKDKTARTG